MLKSYFLQVEADGRKTLLLILWLAYDATENLLAASEQSHPLGLEI